MLRPFCDSEFIFGLHDPGGEQIMLDAGKPGWVLFTEMIGRNPNDRGGGNYTSYVEKGLGVMVRLNHGYEPDGTIPVSRYYEDFAKRCANFVAASFGCHTWIIGNEMNFVVERPQLEGRSVRKSAPPESRSSDEVPFSPRERADRFNVLHPEESQSRQTRSAEGREVITPQLYARCYRLCRDAIRSVRGHEKDQVLVGGVAPWNNQTQYEGNPTGDWVRYFQDILKLLGPNGCDGFTLHTYTHGDDPNLVNSTAKLDPPFQNYHYHFYAYRDFMNAVPASMRHLPVYITETDQDVEWRNENRGWVRRAYGEINWWNSQPGNQQIRAVLLYRWPKHDKWYIQGKQGVIDDFREALNQDYRWSEMPKPQPTKPAYRATFLEGGGIKSAEAGQVLQTRFQLRNDGSKTWAKGGANPVHLGFHWQTDKGQAVLVPADKDFRTPLPNDVKPGESVTLENVQVAVPDQAGSLRLRWDLVEEGVTWFKDKGSAEKVETVTIKEVAAPVEEIVVPETGKRVRGAFLAWYRQYGLDVTGYPYTDQFVDPATALPTQVFQRVVMEEYQPGRIRLRLAGEELLRGRQALQAAQAEVTRLTGEVSQLRQRIAELEQQVGDPQPTLRIPAPEFVDITEQLPRDAAAFQRRDTAAIRYLVVNHTGGAPDLAIEKIAGYHRQRGYPGIAYHFFIDQAGVIFQTNPLTDVVSLQGYLGEGLNVAIAGKFDDKVPTEAQMAAAARLCAWLLQELNLESAAIMGVNEFVSTGSPGWQWLHGKRYKDTLLALVAAVEPVPVAGPQPGEGADVAELRAQIAALQAQLADKTKQLAAAQAEVTRLQAEVQTRDQRITNLTGQVTQLTATVSAQQAEIARLRAELAKPGDGARPSPGRVSQPVIHDVVDKLPKHATLRYATRSLDKITHLCIHHSATPATISLERIAEYHIKPDPSRNKDAWPGIGYHFYVKPDGTIYQTNRLETMSYHVYMNNDYAVGICVGGDFTRAVPTQEQLNSAAHLVAWLMQELNVPLENVRGHKEYPKNDTSCPGVQWLEGKRWKNTLQDGVRAVQAGGSAGGWPKSLYHYILFWQRPDSWAREDWLAAEAYIGRFRVTTGFSVDDARNAEYVTIVGGVAGVSYEAEQALRAAGCKVERLAGADFADTKRILDELAQSGRRFRDFPG